MNPDSRTLLMSGWMRETLEYMRLDPYLFVDDLLKYFAIWLDIKEQWREDIISDDLVAHNSTGIVRKEEYSSDYGYSTAFGCLCIRKGEYKIWRLQIFTSKYATYPQMFIGIFNANQYDKINFEETLFHTKGYALNLQNGTLHCEDQVALDIQLQNYQTVRDGDILEVLLDLTDDIGILGYQIKNKFTSLAFDNIDCNKSYCLAVSWTNDRDRVRLLEDNQLYDKDWH
eukprot:464406_1